MWRIKGVIIGGQSPRTIWQHWEYPKNSQEEGLFLIIESGSVKNSTMFSSEKTLRAITKNLREEIEANNIEWLRPAWKEWRIDLDKCKEYFQDRIPDIMTWAWFCGKVWIEVEYTVNDHNQVISQIQIIPATVYLLEMFQRIVTDHGLAEVLSLRWQESKRALEADACLSVIILLGSILEGLLYAKLQDNLSLARQQNSTPKDRHGAMIPLEKWRFDVLIKVAYECQFITNIMRDCAFIVRDYRNLVHPKEQQTQHFFPDVSTCEMIRNAVESAILHLSK